MIMIFKAATTEDKLSTGPFEHGTLCDGPGPRPVELALDWGVASLSPGSHEPSSRPGSGSPGLVGKLPAGQDSVALNIWLWMMTNVISIYVRGV